MKNIIIHAGNFDTKYATFENNNIYILNEIISISDIIEIETVREEDINAIAQKAGWSTLGWFALGPIGLLAGLCVGGKRCDVTFITTFKDGRKILASTDSKIFMKFKAIVFQNTISKELNTEKELTIYEISADLKVIKFKEIQENGWYKISDIFKDNPFLIFTLNTGDKIKINKKELNKYNHVQDYVPIPIPPTSKQDVILGLCIFFGIFGFFISLVFMGLGKAFCGIGIVIGCIILFSILKIFYKKCIVPLGKQIEKLNPILFVLIIPLGYFGFVIYQIFQ